MRHEKVFGEGLGVPLDRNQKARIAAYAAAWSRRHRAPGQHKGPITRAFLEVLNALLWGFHNAHTGRCFPSYEAIAAKAGCSRSTVRSAIHALESAGVLTWQNRLARIRERCRDLFGREGWRWRVIRTSNAYAFRLPASEVNFQPGTGSKRILEPAVGRVPVENRSETALRMESGPPQVPIGQASARLA